MGFLDGLTANLTRPGPDGQAYYAPAGRLGPLYLVPDERAAVRVRREWKGLFVAMFASIPIVVLAVGPGWFAEAGWKLVLPAPVAGLAAVAYGFVVARGLPRATIGHDQLIALPGPVVRAQVSRAMGQRTLRIVLGLALFMTVVGLLTALMTPSLTLWLGAAFFATCTVSLYRTYRARRRIPK